MNIETVWNQYQASLKAFLYSRINDPADADDLLQDILIKSYRNLGSLQSQGSIKAWLFQIANRSLIDFYRRKGNRKEFNAEHPDLENLWETEDNHGDQPSMADCVEPFINALPEDNARLLMAIDIHGESQKDYAAKEGIAYSTLKSRVQKSRNLLRGLFEECCHLNLDHQGNIMEFTPKGSHCKKC